MLIPAVVLVTIFSYGSMAGVVIAFQKFVPAKGMFGHQQWVGFQNFHTLFSMPNIGAVIRNTVIIAVSKMIAGIIVPVAFALLLNEVRNVFTKRFFQTLVYLPHFLSWVILSGILINLLSPSAGFVNILLTKLGIEPVYFLGDPDVFPVTMVITDIWKAFGFGSVIYLASLTGINPALYEAAVIDGANRWKQTLHITLPGISSMIVLMTVLGLANILNGGFDQIYNMYSPVVYSTGDILDTFVFRLGIEQAQYSLSTAAGLFKSGVSMIFIIISYLLADKFTGYRVF
ncbi:ABC transporter permease [Paenibacillus hexagrammi]|uniref:ABC transporter permease subunit n=1 Tax=Paenibacillus hexagrammi TaxID=2908839 RepID=A0ABY3STV6_9BACL|nr:ABC transporter permease subunit [Paenibacillus sp. YPD9-1]UJF36436.1 ABC transporter permease subunit [Paenibacillus sp. YPD9-1]